MAIGTVVAQMTALLDTGKVALNLALSDDTVAAAERRATW